MNTPAESPAKEWPVFLSLSWLCPLPLLTIGCIISNSIHDNTTDQGTFSFIAKLLSGDNGFFAFGVFILLAGIVATLFGIVSLFRREKFFILAIPSIIIGLIASIYFIKVFCSMGWKPV